MKIKFYRYAKTDDPDSVRSKPLDARGSESLPLEVGAFERAGLWIEINRARGDLFGADVAAFDAKYPHLAALRKEIERVNNTPEIVKHLPMSDEPHECEGHAYQPASSEPIEVNWS